MFNALNLARTALVSLNSKKTVLEKRKQKKILYIGKKQKFEELRKKQTQVNKIKNYKEFHKDE